MTVTAWMEAREGRSVTWTVLFCRLSVAVWVERVERVRPGIVEMTRV